MTKVSLTANQINDLVDRSVNREASISLLQDFVAAQDIEIARLNAVMDKTWVMLGHNSIKDYDKIGEARNLLRAAYIDEKLK